MLEVPYQSDGLVVAVCDRILVTSVTSEITLEFLEEAFRAGRELGTRGLPVGSLTLTSANIPIPSGEVRQRASEHTKLSNAWVGAGATVIGGTGFRTSVMRSMLTAMTLFSGGPPRRVFRDNGAALGWLAEEVKLPPAPRHALRIWLAQQVD